MTTNASNYYERAAHAARTAADAPIVYKRDYVDGELVAMLLGALVFGFALAFAVVGMVLA